MEVAQAMSEETSLELHVEAKVIVDVESTEGTAARRCLEGLGTGTAGFGQEDDEDGCIKGKSEWSVERRKGRICVPEFDEVVHSGFGFSFRIVISGHLLANGSSARGENFVSYKVGRWMNVITLFGCEGHDGVENLAIGYLGMI